MKKTLIVLILISSFLAACAPATPTPDINATVSALSATSIAGTLTALPTNTLVPTDTPFPTDTPAPSNTPEPIVSDTPTATDTPIAEPTISMTPQVFVGCFAPAGTANISVGVFRFENNTKETIEVYLHGESLNGNKSVDCSYTVTSSFNTEIIFGNYSYTVQIGSKKTVDGTFMINNSDKTTMRIYDKKVVVVGP